MKNSYRNIKFFYHYDFMLFRVSAGKWELLLISIYNPCPYIEKGLMFSLEAPAHRSHFGGIPEGTFLCSA